MRYSRDVRVAVCKVESKWYVVCSASCALIYADTATTRVLSNFEQVPSRRQRGHGTASRLLSRPVKTGTTLYPRQGAVRDSIRVGKSLMVYCDARHRVRGLHRCTDRNVHI